MYIYREPKIYSAPHPTSNYKPEYRLHIEYNEALSIFYCTSKMINDHAN